MKILMKKVKNHKKITKNFKTIYKNGKKQS